MYRWTYELYSPALLVNLATTFPCLMLLAKLPTIEARYSRTTPPRLDCVGYTSGLRSAVAFLRPTSVSTLFSTTVEKKGATTRWRSPVTLLLPRGTRTHHTAVLKAFPGVYTVKVPSSDWSDQRFNLQDEESRIPRYVYRL